MNQRDDIILGGKDREEHNRTLKKVILSAKEYGVKFNQEKSEFGKTEIKFFVYLFTSEELKPEPRNLDNFIRNNATLSAPLRNLTRNKTRFKWNSQEKSNLKS